MRLFNTPVGDYIDGVKITNNMSDVIYIFPYASIDLIYIDPAYRGYGIATNLLNRALRYTREYPWIFVVRSPDTPETKELFEKAGFIDVNYSSFMFKRA